MSTTAAHERFFDVWSAFYRATPLLSGHLARVQRRAIAGLGLPRGSRVLDLGCGPGDGLTLLRRRGLRAVGGDLSAGMMRRAVLRSPVARLSALALPFRDGAFDGLVCTNSFHHYPDPRGALLEMRRVLRFGGRLALVDPSAESLAARLAIYGGERLLFGMSDVHLHDRDEWRRLLEDAGFDEVEVRPAGRLDLRARASLFVRASAA